MATYYVYSGAAGTNAGTSWTNAYTSFASAVTAASTNGDVILVHYTHQENVGAEQTYSFSKFVSVISVNKDASNAPTPMGAGGWIGSSVTAYTLNLLVAEATPCYFYGVTWRVAEQGVNAHLRVFGYGSGNASIAVFENCVFWMGASGSAAELYLGMQPGNGGSGYIRAKNCVFRFGSSGSNRKIKIGAKTDIIGGSLSSAGGVPPYVFAVAQGWDQIGAELHCVGFDASHAGSSPLFDIGASPAYTARLVDCKLGSAFTVWSTQTGNLAGLELYLYNCNAGDVHYAFGHYNALGSCVAYTAIRANAAPTYDGTNGFSWRIDTSALATYYNPYITPWISTYHDGTSAITPSVEILRDGSATAYDNDEVWGEFSYQGATGYPIATIVDDRMALLGTPAAQTTGSLSGSGWTGENATAWFGKVSPTATITPAEIGELRARICVGVASATVYVDPQIRT
jgi:hypothetical protein